jgi:hypothetical protein
VSLEHVHIGASQMRHKVAASVERLCDKSNCEGGSALVMDIHPPFGSDGEVTVKFRNHRAAGYSCLGPCSLPVGKDQPYRIVNSCFVMRYVEEIPGHRKDPIFSRNGNLRHLFQRNYCDTKVVQKMKNNNIIPFKVPSQAEVEREIVRALARFGDDNIEVMAIVCSWGNTMNDHQVLAALRKLNRSGSSLDNITDRAD